MQPPIIIWDPTTSDTASKVRGIGRYVQLLRATLSDKATFVNSLEDVPWESIFITPFYTFHTPPLHFGRIAKKQLAVIHDVIPMKYPAEYPIGIRGFISSQINKFGLKWYDSFITDSESSKQDIIDKLGLNSNIVHVLYPVSAHQPNTTTIKAKAASSDPYLLYVGDATWNKNLIHLAQAVKKSGIRTIFVGKVFDAENRTALVTTQNDVNPWLKELKGFFDEIADDPLFELKGFVSDEELSTLYRNAAANLLVSRDEGFGYSYLEAAIHGCPSVVADRPIFHEIARDTALFADPEDAVAIATAISRILQPDQRQVLQDSLPANLTRFTLDSFRTGFLSVLRTLGTVQ